MSRRAWLRPSWRCAATALMLAFIAATPTLTIPTEASPTTPTPQTLYLVTLTGPGTSGDRDLAPTRLAARHLRARQDATLRSAGAPEPIYRWTTALNGYAVRLTDDQARRLAADDRIRLVEPAERRRLASHAETMTAGALVASSSPAAARVGEAGRGTVVGVVDSGLAPEGPVFAGVPQLGPPTFAFRGSCRAQGDWTATMCTDKVVGARWFVDGFGREHLSSRDSLSPLDVTGHGTAIASVAVGNSGVSVHLPDEPDRLFSGVAANARLAVYKACWTSPDPTADGCSTADLVTAVDRATADRVDVLAISTSGPQALDTVDLALLGAAEADIAVIAPAGNSAHQDAGHPWPWVTTVGGISGSTPQGRLHLDGGPDIPGVMTSRRDLPPAPIVNAATARLPGVRPRNAALCLHDTLDASVTAGAIVVCRRGEIGRIDKSLAVDRADGIAMVLVNRTGGSRPADLHSVPTLHLSVADGRRLNRWLRRHPRSRASLTAQRPQPPGRRLAWSSGGDPSAVAIKPDLVAPATNTMVAVPPTLGSLRWATMSGTSIAAARVAGAAAAIRSTHPWSAPQVRSALTTTTRPSHAVLDTGAGNLHPPSALRPGLTLSPDPSSYRRLAAGKATPSRLNTPSIAVTARTPRTITRTITNVTDRRLYFSSRANGFESHEVWVMPAAVRLGPGESQHFRVRIDPWSRLDAADDGFVVWRGATGTRTRIPVRFGR